MRAQSHWSIRCLLLQHILRDGVEMDVDVPTILLPGHTTDRIVQYVGHDIERRNEVAGRSNRIILSSRFLRSAAGAA